MKNSLTVCFFGLLFAISNQPAISQELLALLHNFDVSSDQAHGPRDKKDFEAFVDGFFNESMKKHHIPGAAFVLVKNDKIFFMKGYGFANLEKQIQVIPEITKFRIASVSKVLTATAAMQLVEKGLLSLDADINDTLKKFKINNPYPTPVTVRHLLTHSAGFDHQKIGRYSKNEKQHFSLADYLQEHEPQIVYPPGEVINYSNYGISLAGYLVEEVTGVGFSDYVEQNIFHKLQMSCSTFRQPITSGVDIATGYEFNDFENQPVTARFLKLFPSGAMFTTAADMAKFMISLLNQDPSILSNFSIREMHRQQISIHPRLPGWALGFYESFANNQRAVMHAGDTKGFSSLLYLLPENNLGFFMTYNTGDVSVTSEFIKAFLNRYFPVTNQTSTRLANNSHNHNIEQVLGKYRFYEYPKFSLEKIAYLFHPESEITLDSNDSQILVMNFWETTQQFAQIEPGLFKQVDGDGHLSFKTEPVELAHLFGNLRRPRVLEKLSWYETISFQWKLLKLFFFTFGISLLLLPLYFYKSKPGNDSTFWTKIAVLCAVVISALNLIFLFALRFKINLNDLMFGVSTGFFLLLLIAIVTTALTFFLPFFTLYLWKAKRFSLFHRLHYTGFALAAIVFVLFLQYWNLLGFQY